MARVISEWHLVVYPDVKPNNDMHDGTYAKRQREACKDMAKQIERHVDGVEQTKLKYESVCEHCESRWTEASDKYNGGCCVRDTKGSPERRHTWKRTKSCSQRRVVLDRLELPKQGG